jgi:hypothetical protein
LEIFIQGVLIGVIATIGMDIWSLIAKQLLKLPTADWAMAGRWFGHMPRGKFIHRSISESAEIPNELAIGWVAHYFTGIVYGLAYLGIVIVLLSSTPSFTSALVFGLVTLAAPWLLMQPCMGAGAFASRTPNPGMTLLVNLSMHVVFGISLYLGWLLIE